MTMTKQDSNEDFPETGVDVTFQPNGSDAEDYDEESSDAEGFDIGVNTFEDHFDEDEIITVDDGYEAWYNICGSDNYNKCHNLISGTFRFHEGKMQIKSHGEWKPFRDPEDDF